MTPQERATDWFTMAPRYRTKELLSEWITCIENDTLERARLKVLEIKQYDISEKEYYHPVWITKAVREIQYLQHEVTN